MLPLWYRAVPPAVLALLVVNAAGHGQAVNNPGAFPNAFPSSMTGQASKYPLLDYQLRMAFDRMDKNQDGYLDKPELALAFRGAKAQPAPPLYDDKGRVTVEGRQAATKYPDLIYLTTLDKDGDDQLSWDEYRTFYENAYAKSGAGRYGPAQAVNYAPRRPAGYYQGLGHSYARTYRNSNRYSHSQSRSYAHSAYSLQRRQQQYVSQVMRNQQNQARRNVQSLAHLQQQQRQYVQRVQAQRQQAYRQMVNNLHHLQEQRARATHTAHRRR
jgi:hypothetical protein